MSIPANKTNKRIIEKHKKNTKNRSNPTRVRSRNLQEKNKKDKL